MLQGHLHGGLDGLELGRRLGNRIHYRAAVPVVDVVEDAERVRGLLLVLDLHPVGEPRQGLSLEVGGHGEVEMRGVQLAVQLVVEGLLELCVQHGVFLLES